MTTPDAQTELINISQELLEIDQMQGSSIRGLTKGIELLLELIKIQDKRIKKLEQRNTDHTHWWKS